MTKELATTVNLTPEEKALLNNDLSGLSAEQRSSLYLKVCQSVGLNPLTQPFQYLELNNKLVLYAQRNCTDQLRSLHNVSLNISAREKVGGLYIVTAKATLPSGRCDESVAAVDLMEPDQTFRWEKAASGKSFKKFADNPNKGKELRGDALANLIMKCETKAKRRVTLSICGLSFLDETEVETIKDAKVMTADPLPQLPQSSPQTDQQIAQNLANAANRPMPEPVEDDLDVALGSQPDQAFDFPPESFDNFPDSETPPAPVQPYKIPFPSIYQGKALKEVPPVQLRAFLKHVQSKASKPYADEVLEFIQLTEKHLSSNG